MKTTRGTTPNGKLAAIDRDIAATAQADEAAALLQQASNLRRESYLYDEEHLLQMSQAGAFETRSGDLYGKAFGNFDKSASNWKQAERDYRRRQQSENRDEAALRADIASERADEACRMASVAFERATEAYNNENARQPAACAAAAERAAQWREKLADRQK
ncbi:MAG: hypothetical protein O3A51_05255 [Verrucomicrobia bacterium]|nr:hypothetical protein [Verrucomicrobiota bacterium]